MFDASIIIATHNRYNSLIRSINSILNCDYDKEKYEIIIVDNKSTDNTRLVKEIYKKYKNFIYVYEEKPGVHFARNRAIKKAKGGILIYTDDDVEVSRNFIKAYVTAFRKYNKMTSAGGEVILKWEENPPKWLQEYIGNKKVFPLLSLMKPYNKFHLSKNGYFFSVNMAVRKEVLISSNGFQPELVGNKYTGNGEYGLYKEFQKKGHLIGYVPDATVYHFIPPHRMTLKYLSDRMENEGISNVYTYYQEKLPSRKNLLKETIMEIRSNITIWLAALLYKGRTDDNNAISIQLEASRTKSKVKHIVYLMFNKNARKLIEKKNWLN